MSRPKKDPINLKSKSLRLRMTQAEYYWLKYLAEKQHISMTGLLMNLMKENIRSMDSNEMSKLSVKVANELKLP